MTFSYVPGQLATVPLYRVRLALGDTQPAYPLLQDEEIDQYLTTYGTTNIYFAAAYAAEAIAGLFSRQVDRALGGGLSLQNSQKVTQYLQLAARLRRQAALGVMPYAGGLSVSEKRAEEQDTDRVPPFFTRGSLQPPQVALPETGETESPIFEEPV
ncbi:MAG: hypothetical protein ACTHMP_16950 [Thermomicrobiales bacterium]